MSWRDFQTALCLAPLAGRGRIASAIRVRGSLRKGGGNRLKDTGHVTEHVVVPKSKNPVIAIDKPFVADRVGRTARMLSTVNFDDQAPLSTDEVRRVSTDRFLPNELMTIQLPSPQPEPERIFSVRGAPPQASRASCLGLINRPHVKAPPHPDRIFDAIRPLPASGARLAQSATA